MIFATKSSQQQDGGRLRSYASRFLNRGSEPGAVAQLDSRIRKSEKIRAVLRDAGMADGGWGRVLDIGCSNGLILEALRKDATYCIGVDVDETASRRITPGVGFVLGDGEALPFPPKIFDVVICNHVYEHTDHPENLVFEIERVLRDDGLCFFSGPNRLDLVEPHYRLPLLSWLPESLADRYVRLTGKGEAYRAKPYTYWGLRRLLRNFDVLDYTRAVIDDPLRFFISDLLVPGSWKHGLARLLVRLAPFMAPDYVLLLRQGKDREGNWHRV